jgi:SAM-dependent methyltransferase
LPDSNLEPWYASILACPDCGGMFERRAPAELWCGDCLIARALRFNADLRPMRPGKRRLEFPVNCEPELALSRVSLDRPDISYAGPMGQRDGTELLSVLQQSLASPGAVLDLGCGPRDQAVPIMTLGHWYVGVDHSSEAADLRADAHALPFAPECFDFVLAYAVLEHLHNPFLALAEVGRVLKAGATLCGTVSLGEPFHNSFFHHTAWGLLSLCAANRFEVTRLWPCWDTLDGLAEMGRYSRAIRLGLRALNTLSSRLPILTPRKMNWPKRERDLDGLHRAASIGFVVRKRRGD